MEEKKKNFDKQKDIFKKEEEINKILKKLKQEEILFKNKNILEKEKNETQENLKNLKEQIKKIWDIKKLEKEIEKITEYLEKKNLEKQEIINKKIGFLKDSEIIIKEWKEITKELENIENLSKNADCPTCKRPLWDYDPNLIKLYKKDREEKRKIFLEIKEKINLEEKKKKEIKKLEKEKEKQKKQIEEKIKNFLEFNQNIVNIEKNLVSINQKLEELKNIKFSSDFLKQKEKEYEQIREKTQKLRIIEWEIKKINFLKEEIKNTEKKLIEFENNKKQIEKNLKNINFDQKKYIDIKKIYENLNNQLLTKTEEINIFYNKKNEFDKEIYKLDELIKKNKDLEETRKNTIKQIDILNLKQKIFWDYSIYLLNFLKPKIEFLASNYFSVATNNKYAEITLDSEYRIKIDGKNIDLYSGWEQDLANLCLRIALWQNLNITNSWNLINFLILDEVLWSQDKIRQENILKSLKKLENKFSQIILISHIEDLKDIWDNLIEVSNINNFESEIKNI